MTAANNAVSRREMVTSVLGRTAVASTAGLALLASESPASESWESHRGQFGSSSASLASNQTPGAKVRYCINTSTIRGQKLGLVEEIELAAKVGYDGIEPWINEIDSYVKSGGKLGDLKKRIADAGLRVESAIGFANWIVDDDDKRKQGLENAKRDMDLVAQIGGKFIAAPPAGATNQTDLDLFQAADRYRALIEVGRQVGVVPQVEVWGFSKSLSRLGECVFVAVESGCQEACILPDIYHIYKGGSGYSGLGLMAGTAIHCFHINDFPADPPREKIGDADRVYPGDGVAPVTQILKSIMQNGFSGALSLELFNRELWKQDAESVLKTGLEKMKASVANVS